MTNIAELDQLFMLNLSLTTLGCLGQVNHYFNEICSDSYFWRQKAQRDFGPIAEIHTYQQLVQGKYPQSNDVERAVQAGRLDELDWLRKKGIVPGNKGANFVARKGDLELLKKLARVGIRSNQIGANWALIEEHVEVLKWLQEEGIFPNPDGYRGARQQR